MKYKDSLKYLDTFVNYERIGPEKIEGEFDLDKVRRVLKRLGDPQRDYRTVHVAGTKGKGSTCAFTASILRESGYTVGSYSSPHLSDIRERISVDGEMIDEDDLASMTEEISEHVTSSEFTFFEILTIAAMKYFSEREVDYAVFETGMGGRLDATNVISAGVCGISPISYDHTAVLGGKIEEIAAEKAAIIKEETICVSSRQRPEALKVIEERCVSKNAALSMVGRDITVNEISRDEGGSLFDITGLKGEYKECRTNMPGAFQVPNCAMAVGMCEKLLGDGIDPDAVKRGLEKAFLPGRMEILSRAPMVVIDGAQNAESAAQLKYSIEQIFKYDKLILLLGLSRDKDIGGVCSELVPLADHVVLTRSNSERAQDPYIIRGYVRGNRYGRGRKTEVTSDPKEALGLSLAIAGKKDLILATGSFYLIAEIRKSILKRVKG